MNSSHKPPELVSVCTDMLNINRQVNDKDKKLFRRNLTDISHEYGITPFHRYGYRQTIPLLKEEQNKTILYCIDHKYPSRPFLHLQLNPSELTKKLAISLRGDLDYLLGSKYEDFFCNSNVSRLDIAADFLNLNLDDFVCKSPRQRRSAIFFDQHGRTQSLYLGHSKSIFQMKIYDKTAKNRSKGICSDVKSITRIEASIKPHCAFKDIAGITNPFEGLMIYKLSDLVADHRLPVSFCDSLHYRGLTATLKLLEADEGIAVKKLLKDHVYQDFPANEIFRQWKISLKKLNPLKVRYGS